MTRQLNNDNGLQARWTNTTGYNSGFKKLAVQWLNEVQFFNQTFVQVDSFVLRNRQLLKPAKRYQQCSRSLNEDNMRRFTILIFGICLFSCSKDGEFEDTYGTKLITIEYKVDTDSWLENYSYSSNDELIKIEDFHLLGRRCEITYLNNLVKEFFTYRIDNNKLIFRDSILYNANGTILAIYKFSINSGENLPLTWIYEFEYSNESRVSKKSTYFVNIGEYTSIEKYYWQGDNITRVEYYNGDELLYYEYFYEYDNKNNYQKERPTSISDPINWSNNNVTKMSYNDYLGNLDLLCRPCIYEYVYNLDNYPVSIKFNSGREMKLSYD